MTSIRIQKGKRRRTGLKARTTRAGRAVRVRRLSGVYGRGAHVQKYAKVTVEKATPPSVDALSVAEQVFGRLKTVGEYRSRVEVKGIGPKEKISNPNQLAIPKVELKNDLFKERLIQSLIIESETQIRDKELTDLITMSNKKILKTADLIGKNYKRIDASLNRMIKALSSF